jgi:hypothetical protein
MAIRDTTTTKRKGEERRGNISFRIRSITTNKQGGERSLIKNEDKKREREKGKREKRKGR